MSETRAANGFRRETLARLIERCQVDIEANLPGAVARLPQTNLDALAAMTAGMTDEQLEALEFYALQIFITTATGSGLERHGAEWGIPRREATRADGVLNVEVATNNVNLERGDLFQTRERVQFRVTQASTSIAPGILPVPAEAVLVGPEGNLAAGTRLETVNPIVGVTGATVAAPGLASGTSSEPEALYRQRILERIQRPPQGGAAHDYRAWMLQYPGATRAWVTPRGNGDGTVVCRFAMDDAYPNGIPPAAELERMLQWLEVRRPVTAEVFVYAPVAVAIDVIVRDLIPDSPLVRQAVRDELVDMLFRRAEPGGLLYRSWFWEAVSIAAGERSHTLDQPDADRQMALGELAILGQLDFVFTQP